VKQDSPQFAPALQKVRQRFPFVEVSTKRGEAVWNRVTLNKRGRVVDAVRFRAPEGERRDLYWALAFPRKSLHQWFIIPAEGRMGRGFRNFLEVDTQTLFGEDDAGAAEGVEEKAFFQALGGASLEPGREYILWFMFQNKEPADYTMALTFVPSAGEVDPGDAPDVLGLPRPRPAPKEGDKDHKAKPGQKPEEDKVERDDEEEEAAGERNAGLDKGEKQDGQ
jgi:hypothetical protein